MGRAPTYTDEQLVDAVGASRSWRGVLRLLGLSGTSAGAMRSARAHADRLGVGYGHFTGQRRWTEEGLREAVAAGTSWSGVVGALGLRGGSSMATIRGHAARLELDTAHLTVLPGMAGEQGSRPDVAHLARAGSLLAAAWFALCGHDVSWPLEPSRYDLLVATDSGIRRVQVKTTTVLVGETWKVYLSTARGERKTYAPDEIDEFFVIDGDLAYYRIPVATVGGLHAIHLGAYAQFRQPQAMNGVPEGDQATDEGPVSAATRRGTGR